MSLPTINDVQAVEPILTNLLVGYQQADMRFVAGRAFPAIPVDKDSGTYYTFTKTYWFLNEMKERAPGSQYARAGIAVSSTTYATLQWALAYPIADEIRANSQIPLDLENVAVQWLAQQSLIRKEVSWATDFMKTSVWGTDDTTSTDWDDYSTSDPVTNILTAKRTVSNNTGYDPNTMILGYIVHNALVNHPDILDRVKYVNSVTMNTVEAALSAVFGVPNYWVGKATYHAGNEAATFSASAIIDDDCLVAYVAPNPGLFTASAGYTFTWAPGGGAGTVLRNRDDLNDTDLIKAKEQWDQKAVATDLGYFFSDIV